MMRVSTYICVVASAFVAANAYALWPELDSKYVNRKSFDERISSVSNGKYFVFLQKFPLMPLFFVYHTEVLVCARDGFSNEDQSYLDSKIGGMSDFAELEEDWWSTRTASCTELGYGGSLCGEECCSVGHDTMALNARHAVIVNANLRRKSLYIYGTGAFDGATAFHDTCDKKCWSNWAGFEYNPLTNNCNTFTSTVLSCVYGLSQKKPSLGISDLVTVSGKCSAEATPTTVERVV
eukprot:TRINITY_DN4286_c0_g1_i5.p1 TRINITY_DN4286_c0_g1~~TRINITY_DN4286_c0_g1_i5.p1  ORF type:complete len:262 (+),score=30.55 TRINITY_DN4286_c0_g1_i5:81-788(+)